jgi:hypothetical protein
MAVLGAAYTSVQFALFAVPLGIRKRKKKEKRRRKINISYPQVHPTDPW